MKCEFCGATIDIESPVCPHCGMQKKQFAKHRRDMNIFKQEFDTVKEGVVEENKRFSKKASYITAICGLVILNLVLIICVASNYQIYKYFLAKDINKHVAEHIKVLDAYEAEGNYDGITFYYEAQSLYYGDRDRNKPLGEYTLLHRFCEQYSTFIMYLPEVSIKGYAPNNYDANRIEQRIEFVVEAYNNIIRMYDQYITDEKARVSYSEKAYSEKHMKSYDDIIAGMDALLQTYCEFDDAQLEEFKTSSKANQILMIEAAMEKEGIGDEK